MFKSTVIIILVLAADDTDAKLPFNLDCTTHIHEIRQPKVENTLKRLFQQSSNFK